MSTSGRRRCSGESRRTVRLRDGTLKLEPSITSALLVLVDAVRQILAGIRQHYTPEQIIGKQIIVVANLAPRQMMGLTSQGMLMAAHDPATGKVIVLSPSEPVSPGSKVS